MENGSGGERGEKKKKRESGGWVGGDGESEYDEEETKDREEGRVGVRDA